MTQQPLPAFPLLPCSRRPARGGRGPPRLRSSVRPDDAAVEARIARVESGLLPAFVVAGQPLPAKPLAQRMTDLKTPGVSVAVINDGAIEWAKGYGVTETGTVTPVTAQTLFQAASISKPVAALAALRLVEQGKLALDEDVNAKLASWKVPENDFTKTEKVTLRRLLSHSAGLTVHGFGGYAADAPVPTLVQVLEGAKPANSDAVRVDVVPGTIWRYSGGGYTVAQLLMTDVTGRPFPDLMAELVLKPVGMTDSTYEQPLPEARRGAAASGHTSDGKLVPGRYHTYPEMAAAGLWTTPTDLAKFLLEIERARRGKSAVLSQALALEMTTAQKPGYGLGLSLDGFGKMASFGHGGSNEGFKCQMTAFFEGGRGAVIMTNGDQGAFVGRRDPQGHRPRVRLAVLQAGREEGRGRRTQGAGGPGRTLRAPAGAVPRREARGRDALRHRRRGQDRALPGIRDALLRHGRGAHPLLREGPRRPADPHNDRRPAQGAAPLSGDAPAAPGALP